MITMLAYTYIQCNMFAVFSVRHDITVCHVVSVISERLGVWLALARVGNKKRCINAGHPLSLAAEVITDALR